MIVFTEQANLADDCIAKRILSGEKLIDLQWYERVKSVRPVGNNTTFADNQINVM